MKGAVVYDVTQKQVLVSRHVTYHESIFPYQNSNPVSQTQCWELATHPAHTTTLPSSLTTPSTNPNSDLTTNPNSNLPSNPTNDQLSHPITEPNTTLLPPSPRKSIRPHKPPAHLKDYICNSISSTCTYPIHHYISYANLSPGHRSYTFSLDTVSEPSTYLEASKHPCWVEAMHKELTALDKNRTWTIVDKPAGVTPIGYKWIYKVKRKADGTLERYKARLVAKGYTQTEGIDFFDTFSPVVKMATVRMLLALAAIKKWHIQQLDVNNAFLRGVLQEEVYMSIPQGLPNVPSNKVCRLLKSLYGLKQTSRKWYEKLSNLLLTLGFKQAHSDHSLFTNITASSYTALLIYVDDIVLVGDSLSELTRVKQVLDKQFGIKDLGNLKFFLGLEAAHSSQGIVFLRDSIALIYFKTQVFLAANRFPPLWNLVYTYIRMMDLHSMILLVIGVWLANFYT